AGLPQHLSVEGDCSQATDRVESVALHARDILRDEHVRNAVAIEITEAYIAAGAELRSIKFLPELRLRIPVAQSSQLRLSLTDPPRDALGGCVRCINMEVLKASRRTGGHSRLPLRELRVSSFEHLRSIHERAHP